MQLTCRGERGSMKQEAYELYQFYSLMKPILNLFHFVSDNFGLCVAGVAPCSPTKFNNFHIFYKRIVIQFPFSRRLTNLCICVHFAEQKNMNEYFQERRVFWGLKVPACGSATQSHPLDTHSFNLHYWLTLSMNKLSSADANMSQPEDENNLGTGCSGKTQPSFIQDGKLMASTIWINVLFGAGCNLSLSL
jgi:hypothetical protein